MKIKRWAIWTGTGVLAVVVGIIVIAQKQHSAADEYKSDRNKWCQSALPTAAKQDSCEDEGPHRETYLKWWYVFGAWPEGITTWAIILTGGFICWQAVETRKAAEASKIAASAASENARSLIISERPWMLVDQLPLKEATIIFRNKGKSPAKIIYWDSMISSWRLTDVRTGEVINETPRYVFGNGESQLVHNIMLAPSDELSVGSIDWRQIFYEHVEDIERGYKHLHVWTCVKYRSGFGSDIYESHACYRVMNSGFHMGGPDGYNSYS